MTRLEHLYRIVRDTSAHELDMHSWLTCPVGIATRDPHLSALGLTLTTTSKPERAEQECDITFETALERYWGFDAVRAFFGLTIEETQALFFAGRYTDHHHFYGACCRFDLGNVELKRTFLTRLRHIIQRRLPGWSPEVLECEV